MNDDKLLHRIDEYLDTAIDEGVSDVLWKATKGTLKGVAWLLENSFDLLSRKISEELQKISFETNVKKIDKLKDKKKRIKKLQKQAEFHKESYVRIIYRIEDELDKDKDEESYDNNSDNYED